MERERTWFLIKFFFPNIFLFHCFQELFLSKQFHNVLILFLYSYPVIAIYLQKMKTEPKFSRIVSSTNKEEASGEIWTCTLFPWETDSQIDCSQL